jgi:hypothetical protein
VDSLDELRPRRPIGRYGAEHQVGMAADIFAAGLDYEIDALLECLEIERACPGIVHQHDHAMGMGSCCDRGHVLDLE